MAGTWRDKLSPPAQVKSAWARISERLTRQSRLSLPARRCGSAPASSIAIVVRPAQAQALRAIDLDVS
jgi:hypothetical protein